ncbi:LacI family transcriptional regulator [Frondihabitans sucicola]|uniref:LacI family transcriptional regulator n=1 Tax=Frondihabitans sucicola TaxID=1268041 RepID=A0ABM8GUA7_9MICO|nr:LacI family DNA-binding transcriptional regulator [Frondihabitans sucicola]BDZ52036.1 LacI family transcriptional regulator [Frondihabitans sucicola]
MPERPTVREVAHRAGVSVGTISNYLNNRKPIAEPTRLRIESAIEDLRFVPNTAVRVMRGARSRVIAFLVPDSGNPYFAEVLRGIEDVAVQHDHVVVTCNTGGRQDLERHYARTLAELRVRATIVVPSASSGQQLAFLRESGSHVVGLGLGDSATGHSAVVVDDVHGGRLAMTHLLEGGHRDIAYFGGPAAERQISGRLAGCHAAAEEFGVDPARLVRYDAASNLPVDRSAAARQILDARPGPTAVVCANDVLALALEFEALRAGLRVPEDIAIVGYDDIEGASTAPVQLTTIRQPGYELGHLAAEMALRAPEETEIARFTPVLVIRESA